MDLNALGALLRFAHLSSNAVFSSVLKEYKLSVEQWVILNLIEEKELTQKELAMMLNSEQSSITRMVDVLEKNDLVLRLTHPSDRRAKLVQITTLGKEVIQKANDSASSLAKSFDDNFTAKELSELKGYLKRITEANEKYLNEMFTCKESRRLNAKN